jgi:hypothetical protein
MYARYVFGSLLAFFLLTSGLAHGTPAIGTAKARGDYRPNAWQFQRDTASAVTFRPARMYQPSTVAVTGRSVQAPVLPSTPTVAQVPLSGQRFSQAPVTADVTSTKPTANGCPAAVRPETAIRRFSVAPGPAGAGRVTENSQGRPPERPATHWNRSSSNAKELWMLPKTDPRKYGGR